MAMQIKQGAKVLIKRLLTSVRKIVADNRLARTRLEKVFTDIYLTNVNGGKLGESDELLLEKGSKIKIAFIDKQDFLKKRIEIGHRFRK